MPKKMVSARLTDQAHELLAELTSRLGVSQAQVIEMALRKFAEREGLAVAADPKRRGTEAQAK